MRDVATDTVPLTDCLLNQIASGNAQVFFRSSLMPHLTFRLLKKEGTSDIGHVGIHIVPGKILEHQQVHRAEIELMSKQATSLQESC